MNKVTEFLNWASRNVAQATNFLFEEPDGLPKTFLRQQPSYQFYHKTCTINFLLLNALDRIYVERDLLFFINRCYNCFFGVESKSALLILQQHRKPVNDYPLGPR